MTVSNRDTSIKLEGGVEAKLGGRYTYSEDGITKHLYIYHVEKDQAYQSNDNNTVVLTPTANWTHDLGDGPWQRYHKQGTEQIVLSKDTWNEVKVADEVQNFNPADFSFVSNRTNEVVDYLERPAEPVDPDKKLDNISEKVAKKMSEDNQNSTLSMLKQAGVDAAKMAGANQANELITSAFKKGLLQMGLTHEFIESEAGHKLMKLLGPLAIHYLADTQSDFIESTIGENATERIKEGCTFATQAAMGDVIEPLMMIMVPLLKDLATTGASSLASAAKGGFTAMAGATEEAAAADPVADLVAQKAKATA